MTGPPDACARPSRATALPPDERRQAIVDAVVPLLVEHGTQLTTRQIAEAAGVAEGTLFRVFDDKAALLHAAAHSLLDPVRTRQALAGLGEELTLEQMVHAVAEQQLRSMTRVMAVLMAVRGTGRPQGSGRPGPPAFVVESSRVLLEELTTLFGRYSAQLRVEPDRAALALRALVFGSRQPWAQETDSLTSEEIATILLAGVRRA